MNNNEIKKILQLYVKHQINEIKEINTSKELDYRLNFVIDQKYVLRINNYNAISEDRLDSITRLVERFNNFGIKAPRMFKSLEGKYLTHYNNYVCYLSEYLDYDTLDSIHDDKIKDQIYDEVLSFIGRFSKEYTNIDLADINSMWSLIGLALLDDDIDEKQENLNALVDKLISIGEEDLANDILDLPSNKLIIYSYG